MRLEGDDRSARDGSDLFGPGSQCIDQRVDRPYVFQSSQRGQGSLIFAPRPDRLPPPVPASSPRRAALPLDQSADTFACRDRPGLGLAVRPTHAH